MAAPSAGTLANAIAELATLGIRAEPQAAGRLVSGSEAGITSGKLLSRLCSENLRSWAATGAAVLPAAISTTTRLSASLSVPVMLQIISATDVSIAQLTTPKLLETSDFAEADEAQENEQLSDGQEMRQRCLKMRLQDSKGAECAAIE
jgi:hypothetical protein